MVSTSLDGTVGATETPATGVNAGLVRMGSEEMLVLGSGGAVLVAAGELGSAPRTKDRPRRLAHRGRC